MRTICLDATHWQSTLDFYDALCAGIGAPQWHGRNLNAFIDTMVYGGINEIDPPYRIRISGTATTTTGVRADIRELVDVINDAKGDLVQIEFEICD